MVKDARDLVASAARIAGGYNAGRMDRETVQEWVRRLGLYPEPYATAIARARDWFATSHADLPPDEVKVRDLAMLEAIGSAS